jgi:hypothetical protein
MIKTKKSFLVKTSDENEDHQWKKTEGEMTSLDI